MLFIITIPSKDLENNLRKFANEINEAKGYDFITIDNKVTKKDINMFNTNSVNMFNIFESDNDEVLYQSPFPILKIRATYIDDFMEIKNFITDIYKEFNYDITRYFINSPKDFFKLNEETPKEEKQTTEQKTYEQKPWFQMPRLFPDPIPNPFSYMNPFTQKENNPMFSITNYPNPFSFANTQSEESKKLETQLDLISLSMDQIDNLMNNLETYYKSSKLTEEIKEHLKTAMKQRLIELNNLIENL